MGILRYLSSGAALRTRKILCTVCGHTSLFIPPSDPSIIRNHAPCIRCRSCSRNRHIAKLVLEEFRTRGVKRLSDFRRHPNLKLFNTASTGPIAKVLGTGPNILRSEYFDGVQPGEFKDGVMNQDLRNLTFADDSFDLVLSEDVFEHIPGYQSGFREVHRVLKPGGKHIFSIPFYFDRPSRELFQWVDGSPKLTEPIEYHGDPVRGQIPCYTHIGYDAVPFLKELGFEVRIELSRYADELRYGIFDCYTFVTTKR